MHIVSNNDLSNANNHVTKAHREFVIFFFFQTSRPNETCADGLDEWRHILLGLDVSTLPQGHTIQPSTALRFYSPGISLNILIRYVKTEGIHLYQTTSFILGPSTFKVFARKKTRIQFRYKNLLILDTFTVSIKIPLTIY